MIRRARQMLPALLPLAPLVAAAATALPVLAVTQDEPLALTCKPLAQGTAETAALPLRPSFTLNPVATARDGAGTIEATGPDGRTATGVAASLQGPFAWTVGTTLNTLTLEGTTADGLSLVLWHRLDQSQAAVPPVGQLTKLICEVS